MPYYGLFNNSRENINAMTQLQHFLCFWHAVNVQVNWMGIKEYTQYTVITFSFPDLPALDGSFPSPPSQLY